AGWRRMAKGSQAVRTECFGQPQRLNDECQMTKEKGEGRRKNSRVLLLDFSFSLLPFPFFIRTSLNCLWRLPFLFFFSSLQVLHLHSSASSTSFRFFAPLFRS